MSAKALRRRKRRFEIIKRKRAGEEVDPVPDSESEGGEEDKDEEMKDAKEAETLGAGGDAAEAADENAVNEMTHTSESPPSDDDSDSWSQSSELSLWDGWNPYNDDDRDAKYGSYKSFEDVCYDPTLLPLADIQWTDRCRALGWNDDSMDGTRAFFTRRGRYDDYGNFNTPNPRHGQEDSWEETNFPCYSSLERGEEAVFPFHEACYTILAKCLGYKDRRFVDKDTLYLVMEQNSREYGRALNLDYLVLEEPEQMWSCEWGEEVCGHYCQFEGTRATN